MSLYGMAALKTVLELALNDQNPQLNVTEMVCELMRLAIEKSDRTLVDFGDSTTMVLFSNSNFCRNPAARCSRVRMGNQLNRRSNSGKWILSKLKATCKGA